MLSEYDIMLINHATRWNCLDRREMNIYIYIYCFRIIGNKNQFKIYVIKLDIIVGEKM